MSAGRLTFSTTVVAAAELLSGEFEEEAVILDLRNGVYYGLEATGARIWQLLQEPISVEGLHQVLVQEYDVEPERCQRDLLDLLGDLLERGLIRIAGGEPRE
jgi:hypothetical protein